jgi:predicted alpha/beta hydrolase
MLGHWRLLIFGVAAMVLGRLGGAEALFLFGLVAVALGVLRFWMGRAISTTGGSEDRRPSDPTRRGDDANRRADDPTRLPDDDTGPIDDPTIWDGRPRPGDR